jgi:hypothetical protein
MEDMDYYSRITETEIKQKLNMSGMLLIKELKLCGKNRNGKTI